MITDDYVSKEIYKLLKKKGYDGKVETIYDIEGYTCPAIHLYDAMKWLREIHKLFITIDWTGYEIEYIWSIQDMNSGIYWESDESYILYEHACDAVILFCLENLI